MPARPPTARRSLPLAVALVVLLSLLGAAPASADEPPRPLPVSWTTLSVLPNAAALALDPRWKPAGSNDPTCHLTPERPDPVVLVNFTTGAGWEWGAGSPFLRNHGYCVFTFRYGNLTPFRTFPIQAVADIRESAQELADEVDRVLAQTGAEKVDLVGWSQGGGMTPHYFLNFLGGADVVDSFVGIAPGNHGTTGSGILAPNTLGPLLQPVLRALLPAFGQQVQGSPLAEEVYRDGDTRPGPRYTTIVSKHDEVATPYTNQFLDGPNATNILLQDGCPKDLSEHLSIGFSVRTWLHVLNALDPASAQPVPCVRVDPFTGMPPGYRYTPAP